MRIKAHFIAVFALAAVIFQSCGGNGSSPEPAAFRVADYLSFSQGDVHCQGEFAIDYPAEATWRDSIGQPVSVSGVQAWPVFRRPIGGSWLGRAYVFLRDDSLFMADSLLANNTFRYVYLMTPDTVKTGHTYTVTPPPAYLSLGPEGEAGWLYPGSTYECRLTTGGETDVTLSDGTTLTDCLKLSFDYSDTGGPGWIVDVYLSRSLGFARLYCHGTGEGVEPTDCP